VAETAEDALEMAARYEPGAVEGRVYALWDEASCFVAGRRADAEPYTIMIPPPNVTGVLHMGHALNNTIQDIAARFHRLIGRDVLWLPGTDHAGIATQAVVEKKLYAERGTTREQIGREAFLDEVWAWRREHGDVILEQLRRLGASCDWTRTKFTLDEDLSRAVRTAFVHLWEKGLIYRGARLVNWDCVLQTAVSDDEIEYVERQGTLWRLRYPVEDAPDRHVVVATTRPETMLGDTGVAVHPDDARYADLVGATLVLPLLGREIPVVADASVDPEFGTGAVKVTPGHDPADYERGARHGLPIVNILEKDGTLAEAAGPYAGQPREEARKAVLRDLQAAGLLDGEEPITHNVSISDRSKSAIEPLVSEQWFVRMEPLAAPAIEAVRDGSLTFRPPRWRKVYLDWLENVRDWCISRQLWWGHRIPVFYDEDDVAVASVDELAVGDPHPRTGKPVVRQDPDVLDTWASSWLWPFATLGWPERTADLQRYYPTQFLSTARDIIYLWVARMVMAGYELLDHLPPARRCPFEVCNIHATVLDAQGRRMSKSLGNGIDPIEMIETYGADAVRYSLIMLTVEGQDTKLAVEKFEMGRNFVNKLWNASRFVLTKAGRLPALEVDAVGELEDRWILARLADVGERVRAAYAAYAFNEAGTVLYHFTWDEVCDWYLEAVKDRLGIGDRTAPAVLGRVLTDLLTMLHPMVPFVTEEVWQKLRPHCDLAMEPLLMERAWPVCDDLPRDARAVAAVTEAQAVVSAVRRLRLQNDVSPRKAVTLTVAAATDAIGPLREAEDFLKRTGRVEAIAIHEQPGDGAGATFERPAGAAVAFTEHGSPGHEVLLHLEGLVDVEAQKADLRRGLGKLDKQIAGLTGKLGNEQFVAKAPPEIVQRERDRLAELEAETARLRERLEALG